MLLQTERLNIGYGRKLVAGDINISLNEGQIIGLLGSNGAGKSTFFKTILNLLPPLAGKISLSGQNSQNLTLIQRVALVAYVPQAQQCQAPFRVNEFILLGRAAKIALFQQPSEQDREICDFYLRLLRIQHLQDRLLPQLSGGEQQLVLIARALAQESRLLLMDEPTSNLDFKNQILVLDTIANLKEQGYTIIFSSHQLNQIAQISDQLLLLNDQTIRQFAEPKQFINADNIAQLFQLDPIQIQKYIGV